MRSGTVLVLGGARSGKSVFGERLVIESGLSPVYVATAEPRDAEMAGRIAAHKARRGPAWRIVEEPLALEAALASEAAPDRAILVDCLTLWLSNLMEADADIAARADALCEALPRVPGLVVLVSNEVGLGLVPDNSLGRAFRDAQGKLNQQVAAVAQEVVFVAAGLPLVLKGLS
jgi:adenosylcobinamide kinase/adenosylcobinamide-phosphate guanylyltransferase